MSRQTGLDVVVTSCGLHVHISHVFVFLCVQTDYVFAAHLSSADALALSKKEATNPRAVHDVISTDWLLEVDQAGELLPIMLVLLFVPEYNSAQV